MSKKPESKTPVLVKFHPQRLKALDERVKKFAPAVKRTAVIEAAVDFYLEYLDRQDGKRR